MRLVQIIRNKFKDAKEGLSIVENVTIQSNYDFIGHGLFNVDQHAVLSHTHR